MNELWSLLADSFWQILLPGLTMTIPLTAISFSLAMVIAIAAALVQFAKIPVLKELCRFYIWVIRGTPLLVQLFVVFYGLPHVGILIDPFPAAVIVFSINEGAYGGLHPFPHRKGDRAHDGIAGRLDGVWRRRQAHQLHPTVSRPGQLDCAALCRLSDGGYCGGTGQRENHVSP